MQICIHTETTHLKTIDKTSQRKNEEGNLQYQH